MGYPLLDQLRRLKAPEFSAGTLEFMHDTTFGSVEDRIQAGLRHRVEFNQQIEQLKRGEITGIRGIEIRAQLSENEMKRAELLCEVAASERGVRLGRQSGEQIILEAREYSRNCLNILAPFLNDVDPVDGER